MLLLLRSVARAATPDEFAAREWRRLLRLRSWRSFPALAGLTLLVLGGGMLLLFQAIGPTGAFSTEVIGIAFLLAVNLAPWILPPLVVGMWWGRKRTSQLLEDMALTAVGATPAVRASFRMQSGAVLAFLSCLSAISLAAMFYEDWDWDTGNVFLILLTEGLVNAWANMAILVALLLLLGSLPRALMTLVPVAILGNGFLLILTWTIATQNTPGENILLGWVAWFALKGMAGVLAWTQVPRLLNGWLVARAEGRRGADARPLAPLLGVAGWVWRKRGPLALAVGLAFIGYGLVVVAGSTFPERLVYYNNNDFNRLVVLSLPILPCLVAAWGMLLLKKEHRTLAWRLSLVLLLLLWSIGVLSSMADGFLTPPFWHVEFALFTLPWALDAPVSLGLLWIAWRHQDAVSWSWGLALPLLVVTLLNIPTLGPLTSEAGLGLVRQERLVVLAPIVVVIKGLIVFTLCLRALSHRSPALEEGPILPENAEVAR